MIVSVHNKSLTYMLPFPLNKSALHEFESFGVQADSLSLQLLYWLSLFCFFQHYHWLVLHHQRFNSSTKTPKHPLDCLNTSGYCRKTEDAELHLAAPRQWHSVRLMPARPRWSRIQRLTLRTRVKFQVSLHQLRWSKSDLQSWGWFEACPSQILTCWHHHSEKRMEVWPAAVDRCLTAALGSRPWSACLPLPLSGMR